MRDVPLPRDGAGGARAGERRAGERAAEEHFINFNFTSLYIFMRRSLRFAFAASLPGISLIVGYSTVGK